MSGREEPVEIADEAARERRGRGARRRVRRDDEEQRRIRGKAGEADGQAAEFAPEPRSARDPEHVEAAQGIDRQQTAS